MLFKKGRKTTNTHSSYIPQIPVRGSLAVPSTPLNCIPSPKKVCGYSAPTHTSVSPVFHSWMGSTNKETKWASSVQQFEAPKPFHNTKSVWPPSDCHFQSVSFCCLTRLWEEITETVHPLIWITAVSLKYAVKLKGPDQCVCKSPYQTMYTSHFSWSNANEFEAF